jgi:hypothetical protein
MHLVPLMITAAAPVSHTGCLALMVFGIIQGWILNTMYRATRQWLFLKQIERNDARLRDVLDWANGESNQH